MIIKMNKPKSLLPCRRTDIPKALLRKCKTACEEYNKQHQETGGVDVDKSCRSSSL